MRTHFQLCRGTSFMQPFKIVVLLILIGLVAVFTFQNTQAVEVTLFFWEFSLSVSLLLLATLIIGVLLGMLMMFVYSVKRSRSKKAPRAETLPPAGEDSLWDS